MDEASQQGIIFVEGSGPTYATVDVSVELDISIVFISLQAHGNLTNCIYCLKPSKPSVYHFAYPAVLLIM